MTTLKYILAALVLLMSAAQMTAQTEPEATAEATAEATPEVAACTVSALAADMATVRVGPGINRSAITFLPAETEFAVQGQANDDDGALWYRLDKAEAAPGKLVNEAWVAAIDVTTAGDCQTVGEVEAPPIIPIVSGDTTGTTVIGEAVTVRVPAQTNWNPTNIVVQAGQTVTITASGHVRTCLGCAFKPEGPAGISEIATEGFPLPGVSKFSLIGRIGTSAPFYIGSTASFTAQASGLLELSMNDDNRFDNAGSFTAVITIGE